MSQSHLPQTRHPELVSGSIPRFTGQQRWQAKAHGQIPPMRVELLDQIDLPLPVPVLELLFAGDRGDHVAVQLEMDQSVDPVLPCEPRQRVIAMLPKPAEQVGCHSNIERTVVPARENVDAGLALLPDEPAFAARWTLKQVQGDGLGSEWFYPFTRHAELVSASMVPQEAVPGMQSSHSTVLAIAIVLAGVVAGFKIADSPDVAVCLDRGGAWDYSFENCLP